MGSLFTFYARPHTEFLTVPAGLADPTAFSTHLAKLKRIEWIVFAKSPFGGPEQVLAYLGRYTHRVAIANSRLVGLDQGKVSFRWKDCRHHDKPKLMTLSADEFIRRFLLHVLPDGFHRIRHYGLLANGHLVAKRPAVVICWQRQCRRHPPDRRLSPALSLSHRPLLRHLSGVRRRHGLARSVAT